MKNYEQLLDKLYSELPDKAKEKSRFKMPVFDSFIQGNQTFVANFIDVATTLRREVKHLSKYLFKELATPGTIDKKRLILKAKV